MSSSHGSRTRSGRKPRGVHPERGSLVVEAAILLPLLVLALFAIMEFGRLFFTKIAIENATREAGRFAVTGNKLEDPDSPSKDLPRPDAIKQYLVDHAPGIAVDKAKITVVPDGGGGPGDIIKITVEYTFEFATTVPLIGEFMQGNDFVILYTTVMKNEPVFTEKRRK
jgi:TadE-like protein